MVKRGDFRRLSNVLNYLFFKHLNVLENVISEGIVSSKNGSEFNNSERKACFNFDNLRQDKQVYAVSTREWYYLVRKNNHYP